MLEFLKPTFLSFAFLLVSHSLPAPAAAQGPGSEKWFEIAFHGDKVGYVRAREKTAVVDGRSAIHVDRWSVITVRRREEVLRIEHTLDIWFEPDGTPLRYKMERTEGRELRRSEGVRDGKRFVVRHSVGGRMKERSYDLQPNDRLASSLEWLYLRKPSPGAVAQGRAIDETEGDIQPFSLRVEKAPGPSGRFLAHETLGRIQSVAELSESEGLIKTELVGAGITVTRAPREQAIQLKDTVDIFSAAMFEVGVDLPPRDQLDRLTLVFSSENPAGPRITEYKRQSVASAGKGRTRVQISAPRVPRRGARLPIKKEGLKRYLSGTDYEDLEDKRLVAASRREVSGAKDAWTAARRINRFVHAHISNKTLARAFASATEALTERAGDCTEHAVLFSALAKIAGIPTKLVTGLVYVGGAQPAFGYHEWVEVWLGDRWHPMDPTFGQDVADATHVKFSEGISDADGLREAGLAAASLIGDVKLSVESFKAAGRVVTPR